MSKTPSNGLFYLSSPGDAYTQRWCPISEGRCLQHGRARTRLVAHKTLIKIRNIKSRQHFDKTGKKSLILIVTSTSSALYFTTLLHKLNSGMGRPVCHVSMFDTSFLKLLWVYCPGHVGVTGNDRADGLAGKATITVEEIETLPAGTKSSHHRSPGGERRGNR